MARKHKRRLSGIAAPVLVREPLLLRLCTGFVSNLALILRTAFIIGAIFLAQDFRDLTEELPQSMAEIEPATVVPKIEPTVAPECLCPGCARASRKPAGRQVHHPDPER
jgi:hypothetical protein